MEKIFNFRPDGHIISTNDGDKKIMVIRRGPRGIVCVIQEQGPIVLWNNDEADAHIEDSEVDLIQKTIDVLNS